MSTPGNSYSLHIEDMDASEAKTPATGKRRLTPDKNPLFKNSQFAASPFISPIPKSLSYIKRHPKCPKRSRTDGGMERGIMTGGLSPGRKREGPMLSPALDSPDTLFSPASSLPSPVGSNLDSPASSDTSPDGLIVKAHFPMESSRIESGTDISSDGERERECKTKMVQFGLQAGIQPLDISSV
ncbi:uncharacterized protein LOC134824826 [Bolinopsis microptera]|uniref:uncharacterized protein LOC134824826 n=1 Tax=Bolinopsis microptera TaxID=2820187 RepID=UPI0030799838